MLIAGDIGATKTLLALYARSSGPRRTVAEKEYRSAAFAGLDPMVRTFLAEVGRTASVGCFDVAGPVLQGKARLTNLPWELDERSLAQSLGLRRVTLLNDLKAVAYALPRLHADELRIINAGQAEPRGPLAIVAPGTGLGEAFLIWDGNDYIACSSEGGHTDFAAVDERQAALWRHVQHKFGHVAYERVCSGSGIPNIYDYLRHSGAAAEPAGFAERLAAEADPTPLIVEAGLENPEGHPLCAAAIDLFVEILGAEAGNLALKVMATGGVFLAGGMPLRILPRLVDGRFKRAFVNKGRFADLLETMPVSVVIARAALIGSALYGLAQLEEH